MGGEKGSIPDLAMEKTKNKKKNTPKPKQNRKIIMWRIGVIGRKE